MTKGETPACVTLQACRASTGYIKANVKTVALYSCFDRVVATRLIFCPRKEPEGQSVTNLCTGLLEVLESCLGKKTLPLD